MGDKRGAGKEESQRRKQGHELVAAYARPLSAARTLMSLPCLLPTVSLRVLPSSREWRGIGERQAQTWER